MLSSKPRFATYFLACCTCAGTTSTAKKLTPEGFSARRKIELESLPKPTSNTLLPPVARERLWGMFIMTYMSCFRCLAAKGNFCAGTRSVCIASQPVKNSSSL
jgi:hypothetical protein